MEHELRLATHHQRVGCQIDMSINKLSQMILFFEWHLT